MRLISAQVAFALATTAVALVVRDGKSQTGQAFPRLVPQPVFRYQP